MTDKEKDPPQVKKEPDAIQLDKIKVEIQKLKAELANLTNTFLRFIPVISGLIAILALAFGVYQYTRQEESKLEQQKTDSNTAVNNFNAQMKMTEKVFRGKFYEKQLEIYLDVSETASKMVNSDNEKEAQKAYNHFLELYDGKLRIIKENCGGEEILGRAEIFIQDYSQYKKQKIEKKTLITSAHNVSAILRNSLGCIWGIGMEAGEIVKTNTGTNNTSSRFQ